MAIDNRTKLIDAVHRWTKTAEGDPIDDSMDDIIERAEFYLRNEEIPGLKTDPETNAAFTSLSDVNGYVDIPSNLSSVVLLYSKDPLVQYNRTSLRQSQLNRDDYYYSNTDIYFEGAQGTFAQVGNRFQMYPIPQAGTKIYMHYYASLNNLGSPDGFSLSFTSVPTGNGNVTLPVTGDFAVTTTDTTEDLAERYAAAIITKLGAGFATADGSIVRVFSESYAVQTVTTGILHYATTAHKIETNALLASAPDVYLSAVLWKAFQFKGNIAMATEYFGDLQLGLEKLRAARTRAVKEGGRRKFQNRFIPGRGRRK